jgi:hypothetical protein
MRMKLSCLMPRGLTVLAVTTLMVFPVGSVMAQYAPYGNSYAAHQPQLAYPNQYQPRNQFMPGPPHNIQTGPQAYANQPYMGQPQYVSMSQQPAPAPLPPMPQSMESVAPGTMQQNGGYAPAPQPTPMDYSQMGQGGYENYGTTGCATGNCGNGAGYSCDGYGNYACAPSYGCCEMAACRPRHHWFGGVYGLLMDRTVCEDQPLVYTTTTPGTGYYPTYDDVVMTYGDLDSDVQGGAEVRFGFTFGCGGGCSDPCGCNTGCGCGALGMELGYWALAEDTTYATVYDADTYADDGNVTYGMKPFTRLRHNPGSGWRPVNHYFAYGIPSADYWTAYGDIAPQIRSIVARNSFSMQNVELNLVCVPLAGGGCTSAGCDSCCSVGGGCDSYGGGSCDMGGGSCGGGCGHHGRMGGGCGAYCYTGPRCQCSTFLGARYVRFDEEFMLRSNYDMYGTYSTTPTYLSSGSLAYYAETDNHLIGCQLGGNGCYHLGCCGRVALHIGANGGVYANYIEMNQFFDGQVYDDGTNTQYDVMAEEDNIAFLGEMRAGVSYQCTCHCRLYGGYRALGVTGVALATSQDIASTDMPYVDCNGSYFLHGVQSGIEFMY